MPEEISENGQEKRASIDWDGEALGGNQTHIYVGDIHAEEGSQVNIAGRDVNIFQRINNFISGDTEQQRVQRNRQNMLKLVWNTWVEGVLKKSLHNEVLIELGLETKPDAVGHPWDIVVQMPDKTPQQVAAGTTILELFDQANGSLVILGEPGSGKTTMLLELCRLAIERAEKDPIALIPVIFNLSSWRPNQTITAWLIDELKDKYSVSNRLGSIWVENDDFLLLFDGLDEVRIENRAACVKAINGYRGAHTIRLAICSRRQEYEALEKRLKLSGAVMIQPLSEKQVDQFLQTAGTGLDFFHQALERDPELREFTQTPLIMSILVLAYQHVAEGKLKALEFAGDYRSRLFDDYIGQMFKRRGVGARFAPEQTIKWLSWLAHSMINHSQTLFYLEDIQPDRLTVPRKRFQIVAGLIGALIAGLIGGLIGALTGGAYTAGIGVLIGGLSIGLSIILEAEAKPSEQLIWSWGGVVKGMMGGLGGLLIGGVSGLMCSSLIGWLVGLSVGGSQVRQIAGLMGGLTGGLSGGLIAGVSAGALARRLTRQVGRPELEVKSKRQLYGLWGDGQRGLKIGLVGGLIGGPIGGYYGWLFGLMSHIDEIEHVWNTVLHLRLGEASVAGQFVGMYGGMVGGLIAGVISGISAGLRVVLTSAVIENRRIAGGGIKASFKNWLIASVLVGLSVGTVGGFIGGLGGEQRFLLSAGVIVAMSGGLSVGLDYGGRFLIFHFLCRYHLYRCGDIPWDLISFLDYATERIFLRKVGGGYIFIHRMLMEYFAEMDDEKIENLISEIG